MPTTAPVIDYLRQLQGRGTTHVMLDEGARVVLRGYLKGPAKTAPPAGATPGKTATPAGAPAASAAPAAAPAPAAKPASVIQFSPDAPPPPAHVPDPVISGSTVEEQLASLREQAADWAPAKSLGTLRDTMVFAIGNPRAELMLVGEAPGYNEERQQEPFVGRAGQKLNQILTAMGLKREDIYISNICKFRPSMERQTTANRKPTRAEMDSCLPFVRAEISLVRPKCIVALGSTAAEGLLHSELPVGKLRGSWHQFQDIPVRVTQHPSYLLHNEDASAEKRKVWDDMLCVMEQLGMEISGKQRGFFLSR